jgi:hypothetical protein
VQLLNARGNMFFSRPHQHIIASGDAAVPSSREPRSLGSSPSSSMLAWTHQCTSHAKPPSNTQTQAPLTIIIGVEEPVQLLHPLASKHRKGPHAVRCLCQLADAFG